MPSDGGCARLDFEQGRVSTMKGREMIRYLKALGLAMVAAFAFSAVAAAGASAQEGQITGPSGGFTLLGAEDPEGTNAFTAFGSEVQCPDTVYTGHKAYNTPHEDITSGDTEVTITPHYAGCDDGEGGSRTVDMRDCDYTFTDFTTTGGGETYGFTADVECDASNGILVTGGACTVRVPPQNDVTGLHATNEGGNIRVHGSATGITASACGGFLHTSQAVLHQDILATDAGGEGVSISD